MENISFEEARYAVFSAIETGDRLEHGTLITCEKALGKQIALDTIAFNYDNGCIDECPTCRNHVDEDDNYCSECGQRLN